MHIIQEEIGPPIFTSVAGLKEGDTAHAVFTIAPLPPGYGMTLGNALRRTLLSSLPGAAVTAVRIRGVQHEYAILKGIKESMMDIILNLKGLYLKKHSKDPEIIRLQGKGLGVLTAKNLSLTSDVEVLNPSLHLATLDKGGEIDMEITIEKGVGYNPAAERNKKNNEPGLIHVDAIYSPVVKVHYDIEAARVGERTNLDKLTIAVVTNGSLTAQEAMQFASQILQSYFGYFASEEKMVQPQFMADFSRAVVPSDEESAHIAIKESYTPIEILNLSPRTLNALINAGVGSVEQLIKCTETTLTNFRGFGTKALDEVKSTLALRGMKLSEESVE